LVDLRGKEMITGVAKQSGVLMKLGAVELSLWGKVGLTS